MDPRHGGGGRRRIGAGWAFGACPELAEGLLSFSGGEKESRSNYEANALNMSWFERPHHDT